MPNHIKYDYICFCCCTFDIRISVDVNENHKDKNTSQKQYFSKLQWHKHRNPSLLGNILTAFEG